MVKKFILFFILLGVVNCNAQGKWYDLDGGLTCSDGVSSCSSYASYADTINNVLYVGGIFAYAGNLSQSALSKWDGTNWLAIPDNGFKDVDALITYKGSLYVGQSNVSGVWRFDGSNWYALPKLNGDVACFCVFQDTLYAGGSFTYGDSTTLNCIAKWSGSKWLPLGKGVYGSCCPEVFALTVYNNQLIAGGYYTNAGNISAISVAVWNGSDWAQLGCCINGYYSPDIITSMEVFQGKLFVADVDSVNNYPVYGVASWDGTNWDSLNEEPELGTILKAFNGYLFMGGEAGQYNEFIEKYDGVNLTPVDSGVNASVYSLAALNGSLYVGGEFDTVGSTLKAKGIARWMPNSAGINRLTVNDNKLSVYPNPTSSETTVTSSKNIQYIKVTDLLGRLIYETQPKQLKFTLDLKETGMYFVTVTSGDEIETKKVVVVR